MAAPDAPRPRIESLDQFRGYTVAAMFLVNFIGSFALVPAIFKHHHTYASYADTVMPQFFFAVGFAYRLVYLRRREADGTRAAVSRAVWRNTALVLLGLAVYHIDRVAADWAAFQERGFWTCVAGSQWPRAIQTLVHIGLTGFWVLPVIGARPAVRVAFLACSGAAFVVLSHVWYYDWLWAHRVIDGGPFGFMTWTVPLLAGSLAHDAVLARGARRAIAPLCAWGAAFMALGYGVACLTALGPASPGAPAAGSSAWPDEGCSVVVNREESTPRRGSRSSGSSVARLSSTLSSLIVAITGGSACRRAAESSSPEPAGESCRDTEGKLSSGALPPPLRRRELTNRPRFAGRTRRSRLPRRRSSASSRLNAAWTGPARSGAAPLNFERAGAPGADPVRQESCTRGLASCSTLVTSAGAVAATVAATRGRWPLAL